MEKKKTLKNFYPEPVFHSSLRTAALRAAVLDIMHLLATHRRLIEMKQHGCSLISYLYILMPGSEKSKQAQRYLY